MLIQLLFGFSIIQYFIVCSAIIPRDLTLAFCKYNKKMGTVLRSPQSKMKQHTNATANKMRCQLGETGTYQSEKLSYNTTNYQLLQSFLCRPCNTGQLKELKDSKECFMDVYREFPLGVSGSMGEDTFCLPLYFECGLFFLFTLLQFDSSFLFFGKKKRYFCKS